MNTSNMKITTVSIITFRSNRNSLVLPVVCPLVQSYITSETLRNPRVIKMLFTAGHISCYLFIIYLFIYSSHVFTLKHPLHAAKDWKVGYVHLTFNIKMKLLRNRLVNFILFYNLNYILGILSLTYAFQYSIKKRKVVLPCDIGKHHVSFLTISMLMCTLDSFVTLYMITCCN